MGEAPLGTWKDTLLQSEDVLFANTLNQILTNFPTLSLCGVFQIKGNWATVSLWSVFLGQLCFCSALYQRSWTS